MTKLIFSTKKSALVLFAIIAGCFSLSCNRTNSNINTNSPGNEIKYVGSFTKSNITNVTKAFGSFSGTFNTTTSTLTYQFSWDSLSSNPAQMHFHDAGPVILQITGFPFAKDGTLSGTATFTPSQGNDLAAGSIYVMIHTLDYTSGEILAYLKKQ